jgi:hypothetical protein
MSDSNGSEMSVYDMNGDTVCEQVWRAIPPDLQAGHDFKEIFRLDLGDADDPVRVLLDEYFSEVKFTREDLDDESSDPYERALASFVRGVEEEGVETFFEAAVLYRDIEEEEPVEKDTYMVITE